MTDQEKVTDQPKQAAKPFGALNQSVDMVATARAAQLSDDALRNLGALKLVAPAKVNLFLNIGDRREDGYHQAENIMHAIALHDVLYLRQFTDYAAEDMLNAAREAEAHEAAANGTAALAGSASDALALAGPRGNIVVKVECVPHKGVAPLTIPTRENIVFRAIDALACELDRTQEEAFSVRIEKHIPHQGGLGGGSADAAAALLGAAQKWGLVADDPVLVRVAQRLGADVAFFLFGGCSAFSGCGEQFQRSLQPMKKSLVLIKPDAGVSTAAAYRAFDESPITIEEALVAAAAQAELAGAVPLANNLAPAAEKLLPELAEVREWAQIQPGVEGVLLCGSGSTTFAVTSDFNQALRVAAAAQARGWWARSTCFAGISAAIAK